MVSSHARGNVDCRVRLWSTIGNDSWKVKRTCRVIKPPGSTPAWIADLSCSVAFI